MKLIHLFLLLFSLNACTAKSEMFHMNLGEKNLQQSDSGDSIIIDFQLDFHDSKIQNTTSKKLDLLVNTIQDFAPIDTSLELHFQTECMTCSGLYPYHSGILFGSHLLILKDKIEFFKSRFTITNNLIPIKTVSDNRSKTNPTFKFSEGHGSIQYINISCDDANYYRLTLRYPDGNIVIDSLINTEFFEYDLDLNGTKEQYILGTRNCSQEVGVFRIRD